LCTFAGGSGHGDPLVPVAVALRDAGHAVAFSGEAPAASRVVELGFELIAEPAAADAEAPEITPLVALDRAHEERVLRDYFAGNLARRRTASTMAACAAWRPDLIVCDEVDFGSMIGAERLGLPHATVLVTAAGSFVRAEVVAAALDALRSEHGLPADPELSMPARHLPPTAISIRPESADVPRVERGREWRPTVYLTLGTVFNLESGDLFDRAIWGLAALPVYVLVTVGRELSPERFGRQPPNVRIERYVAHAELLPRVDAVVSHGGSGTVIGALAHGLPQVVLPMGADQPQNAERCEALGLGIALDAVAASPRDIGRAVTAVLGDSTYRLEAIRMRDEIAALPGARAVVPTIENLAR
jgi:UDP:flavonoid glycosyltransferase YjiC (YdhE family)